MLMVNIWPLAIIAVLVVSAAPLEKQDQIVGELIVKNGVLYETFWYDVGEANDGNNQ